MVGKWSSFDILYVLSIWLSAGDGNNAQENGLEASSYSWYGEKRVRNIDVYEQ